MKKNLAFSAIFSFIALNFIFAKNSLAWVCNSLLKNCDSSISPNVYTNSVLSAVISLFFIVGIIYFFWHVIFAGYHYIASDGDPKKIESSRNEITYSVLGIFVIFSIFAIMKLVGIVFDISGLDTLNIILPTL